MKYLKIYLCLVINSVSAVQLERVLPIVHSQPQSLELVRVELYFSSAVPFNIKKEQSKKLEVATIVLPHVQIANQEAQVLNEIQGSGYHINVTEHGDMAILKITYDPQLVLISCDPIVSLHMKHGISVQIFNQAVLSKIQAQDKPILSVACL